MSQRSARSAIVILSYLGLAVAAAGPREARGEPPGGTGATTTRVSLARILAHADREAPAVKVARADLLQGAAQVSAASALLPADPELSVAVGPRLSGGERGVDLEASLSQQLEVAGERGLRIQAAERQQDHARAGLEQVRWEVHRAVHAAYHAAVVRRERLRVAEQMAAFAGRMLEITRKRNLAGDVSLLHVSLAEGELAQARQRQLRAAQALRAACLTLAEVSGWPLDRPVEPAGGLDPPGVRPSVASLTAQALAHHPGLRTQHAAVRAAEAQVALARREAAPKPALGIAYSREAAFDGAANHVVLGTLSLSIPLWRGARGERALARAAAAQASARQEALRDRVRRRVAQAAAELDACARRIAVHGQGVAPAFERSLQMFGRAFAEGKVDVLAVMVARSRVLESQRERLDAYEDYYAARAALEAAVGLELWPAAPAGATTDARGGGR